MESVIYDNLTEKKNLNVLKMNTGEFYRYLYGRVRVCCRFLTEPDATKKKDKQNTFNMYVFERSLKFILCLGKYVYALRIVPYAIWIFMLKKKNRNALPYNRMRHAVNCVLSSR